jgi:hypothetical protein
MTTKKTRKATRSAHVPRRRVGPSKVSIATEFVVDYIRKYGKGPTYTMIQKASNVGDTSALFAKLVKNKVITYTPGDYTTARLVGDSRGPGPGLAATRPAPPPLNVALPRPVLEMVKAKLEEEQRTLDTQLRAVDAALAAAG